jgi:hypothetical protein
LNLLPWRTEQQPPDAPPDGYIPYEVALRTQVLDLDEASEVSPSEAAAAIQNGRMPRNAGVVDLGGGEVGAFDLLHAYLNPHGHLVLGPHPKSAVEEVSRIIVGAGTIGLFHGEDAERLRLIAVAMDAREAAWESPYLGIERGLGACTLHSLHTLDVPADFEKQAIDLDRGEVTFAPRVRIF